jgi:phosphotransferase system  glucose/maltose/N-acetylglucosamine-specific IIC component
MTGIKTNTRGSGNVPLRSLAYALLVAILVAFGLHTVFIAGPAMRAAAHESVVRAVADEDHQFCEMFGMRSGTDAFAACSRELSIVRQRQVDRDNAAAQGIL